MNFLETVGFIHILLYCLYGLFQLGRALIRGLKQENSFVDIFYSCKK